MEYILELLRAFVLGIIEGITEWLPVSSTGHLILAERYFPFRMMGDAFFNMFLYVIQLGAILAVVVCFFNQLNPFSRSKTKEERSAVFHMWKLVIIGVLPAGIIGILFNDLLEERVFVAGVAEYVVVAALLVYGVLFIVIERTRGRRAPAVEQVSDLTWKQALLIGCFQVLSIIPGTSRSGSTILGGMLLGVSRRAAASFSFFMAIPIMAGVSALKIGVFAIRSAQNTPGYGCTGIELASLAVGFVVSFVVSLLTIRFLMEFVRRHSFEAFGWYRIGLGLLLLVLFACGL